MNREQGVAAGLFLFSLIYLVGAWRLPRFALASSVIDAHIFPLMLGGLLLVLSVIYFLRSRGQKPAGPLLAGVNKPLLWQLMGVTLLYALVLSTLGYLLATALFLSGTMALLGLRRWGKNIAVAVGFSVVTYGLFVYLLKVPLAQGILPF